MLTNKHLQSWGIPSESILLLPPEVLAVSWRRFVSGLDQAPLPSMHLVFNSVTNPFLECGQHFTPDVIVF